MEHDGRCRSSYVQNRWESLSSMYRATTAETNECLFEIQGIESRYLTVCLRL